MRLVLDASAGVNALVPGQLRDATLQRFAAADLFAPTLIDTEVLSALARLERAEAITTTEADRAVHAWSRLPFTRVPTDELAAEIWALRKGLRISDAHYVTLARLLGAPLLTADGRLARAPVRGLSVLTVG
ncbi:type II toxin-antitoxin system VapC family toxin [Ornithinimicrobium cavernae]|uniref:type II toxin-antitoxin system VapC family toxin n=1 Tax=Ornithinimicrobium cavernae TaxID=2666047 RepID=UPI000D687A4A|nr:type II toxin-antitoxin system VapC family toxin [Ornithinimicrobium cavernae]